MLLRLISGVSALVALLAVAPPGAANMCLAEEPADYRMTDFLASVPCTLAGAAVVTTQELRELTGDASPLLIDVMPAPRKPAGLDSDALWLPPKRRSIPGAVWLPNTGFGVLPVEEENYLRANLERLSSGDRSRAMVLFCLSNCWMSWNAARRAVAWGYSAVSWYPHGSDGWEKAGLPLANVTPVPRGPGE